MGPTSDAFANLSLEEKTLVNGACQRFESALRQGAEPSIAEYVAEERGVVREVLLRELLILASELALREKGTIDVDLLIRGVPEARSMAGAALEQARRYAELPESLGRFRLKSVLGSGSFGTVFLAEDPQHECDVALKVPHLTTLFSPELRQRFLREGEAASALDHPSLVRVREVGEAGLVCYIASEYVEGTTLREWLQERQKNAQAVSPEFAARITLVLAEAIQHAHERGVLHCDLKPGNILLSVVSGPSSVAMTEEQRTTDNGQRTTPKIADFGLARIVGDQSNLSQTGQILGTPSYMAPEQARGDRSRITARTDVYGLGAVLYELLTGRPPFEGVSLVDILSRVLVEEPVRPRSLVSSIPGDLEAVCLQCLEKEPQRRYASAAALADDVKRFLGSEPVGARRVGIAGRAWRWSRRKPVIASLVALLAVAVVAGFSVSLVLWYQAASNETRALASEAEALRNLRNEEAARQDAEEHYIAIRQLLTNSIRVHTSESYQSDHVAALPDSMLDDAKVCLSRVIPRRPKDMELRGLFADVLTRQGLRQDMPQSLISVEAAARQWEMIPSNELREQKYLASRATTYEQLGYIYCEQGDFARSINAYETSLRWWEELAADQSDSHFQDELVNIARNLGQSMFAKGASEEEVFQRFAHYGRHPELVGGEQGRQVLLVVLRIERLAIEAKRQYQLKRNRAGLAAIRDAAGLFDRTFFQPTLQGNHRVLLICPFILICTSLRQGGAPREGLVLAERVIHTFQKDALTAPENHYLFGQTSSIWLQIGKARWDLNQAESALDAYRHALADQRRACILAPSVWQYRKDLGWRYMQLGRKLCELGRLDEAEACFHERQALWPGNATKDAEVVRELRKWADRVGAGKADLAPEERQERQRYLDLCLRLERRGSGPATRAGNTTR
jgi:serine/threonine protein kinase